MQCGMDACLNGCLTAKIGSAGYTSTSAVLNVNTNHTNPFSSGSMFRRTGLEGDGVSYTDEGIAYSDPITCVVGGVPSQHVYCLISTGLPNILLPRLIILHVGKIRWY